MLNFLPLMLYNAAMLERVYNARYNAGIIRQHLGLGVTNVEASEGGKEK